LEIKGFQPWAILVAVAGELFLDTPSSQFLHNNYSVSSMISMPVNAASE
jgi:hypothetical protein